MSNPKMAFSKKNYIIMLTGLAVLAIGFVIMSMDKADYGFGFLGLTLGPIVVMAGFIIQFYAILSKPKQ